MKGNQFEAWIFDRDQTWGTEETEEDQTGRGALDSTKTGTRTGMGRDLEGIEMLAIPRAVDQAEEEDISNKADLVDMARDPLKVTDVTETILETVSRVAPQGQALMTDDAPTRDHDLLCLEMERLAVATQVEEGAAPARRVPAREVGHFLLDLEVARDPLGRTLRILVPDQGQGPSRHDHDPERLTQRPPEHDLVLEVSAVEAIRGVRSERRNQSGGAPVHADRQSLQHISACDIGSQVGLGREPTNPHIKFRLTCVVTNTMSFRRRTSTRSTLHHTSPDRLPLPVREKTQA